MKTPSDLRLPLITKCCPECGPRASLVIRTNKRTKELFLGCERYPECRYTEPMPEALKMRVLGAPTLF